MSSVHTLMDEKARVSKEIRRKISTNLSNLNLQSTDFSNLRKNNNLALKWGLYFSLAQSIYLLASRTSETIARKDGEDKQLTMSRVGRRLGRRQAGPPRA
jgi:hypothetical protein